MENRRLFSFLISSLVILLVWNKLFPPPLPPAEDVAQAPGAESPAQSGEVTAPGTESAVPGDTVPSEAQPGAAETLKYVEHPTTTAALGSSEADSGYALSVVLTSAGAAIESVSLTPPQFHDLTDREKAAQVVGNNKTPDRTLSTSMAAIDQLLQTQGKSLQTVHWKLTETINTDKASSATFEFDSPDGSLRLRKTYLLPRSALRGAALEQAWHNDPSLFTINMTLDMINLSQQNNTINYSLQGPVGLLLENPEHTSKYRDLHLEFDDSDAATLYIATLQSYCDDIDLQLGRKATLQELADRLREDHEWVQQPRYAGIDVQYFSAMLAPIVTRPADGSPATGPLLDRTWPMLIGPDLREPRESFFIARLLKNIAVAFTGREVDPRTADLSFRFASQPIVLAPGQTVTHPYALFVGPKRRELLDPPPFSAGQVLNYGITGSVARVMHFFLDTFHGIGLPYFAAIISLTVLVRGCLFPLSRKQAIMAARQKELQPALKALKERCGDDQQRFAREQWDLFRKNNINPLAGCLPLLLQFPIFIGLYTALNSAVDLRGQRFLWIDNLAGPDALFRLPFQLPFGMGYDFNLLPLLTVALFLIQQKLFMPPAQDEQQEMQYRMMNFMTGIMGIMFWHQPAGLCIYFIASSLWSISERKLLGSGKLQPAGAPIVITAPPDSPPAPRSTSSNTPAKSNQSGKPKGFFQQLLAAAEEAQRDAASRRAREENKGKKR